MNKTESKPATSTPIKQRVIAPIQSPGDLTKSTTLSLLASWLRHAGVPFSALDADSQHWSMSRRNPNGSVYRWDATANKDKFHSMIKDLADDPVLIVDFPSQKTDFLLSSFAEFRVLDGFERNGIRPTFLIFASNETKAKESASAAVAYFGDRADYLLIENPAKFDSDEFKKKKLYRLLVEKGTPTIRFPSLTETSINQWDDLERREKRAFSFDEVCDPEFKGLDWFTQGNLQHLRNQAWAQFEDHAFPRIVPDADLIKNRVPPMQSVKLVFVADSGLNDDLLG
jgi:hypothetical protein